MNNKILILPPHLIEQVKWDDCVHNHLNGLIYGQYDYLDSICDHWHGIVVGNYEAVMALPWRKKYGFRYYYTPPFMQQLGIMGNLDAVNHDTLARAIRQFAWYGDLHLNFSNHQLASALQSKNKTNFIINLKNGFEAIQARYSNDLKQILQKNSQGLLYSRDDNFLPAIESYREYYAARMPHVSEDDFLRFSVLCKQLANRSDCIVRSVRNHRGIMLSNVLLLKDKKRIYHLFNTVTPEGRTQHSNHKLINQVLQEFAGQDLLFDFEGSELEGVSTFNKKFGGHIQPYFHYKRNLLRGV
ncbi:hypothetical protein [Sediminibacterium sp.]|uniref:hypothetical protein n=1 Tax=Sediminibacterium sp. TaxID=1917865 RepID=UPI0025EF186D|nr:hypothetical protein [Sediminibacterium sp.]MBW0179260.1 hypothetical protein [Sediminibacterium sp.]